jgi:hypothetical protein
MGNGLDRLTRDGFLTAVLNAPVLTQVLAPLQSRGEHNPRDFHKVVWRLPIPLFEPAEDSHTQLARLAERAESVSVDVDVSRAKRFEGKASTCARGARRGWCER